VILAPFGVGYHLERPVHSVRLGVDARGQPIPGLRRPAELRAFVRAARHPDGSPFRAGDVLLVSVLSPSHSWDLRGGASTPPFGVGRVVDAADGLDVRLTWLSPEAVE